MTTNSTPKPDAFFPEAPASWNTKYITPEGFECQLTLRGDTGQEILEKSHGAIVFLLKNGCTPSVKGNKHTSANGNNNTAQNDTNPNGNGHNTANEYTQDNLRDWCPIHECTMKRWEKDGRVWYSHKVNGEWGSAKLRGFGEWGRASVAKIVKNPTYMGVWEYGKRAKKNEQIHPRRTWNGGKFY